MCPQRFIIEQNIDHFHSRFLFEEDPEIRDMLLRLLVEEENKFGSRQEKIDAVNRKITRGLVLIEKQSEIIERIHKNGGDISIAEKTFSLLRQSQEALTKFLSLAETG